MLARPSVSIPNRRYALAPGLNPPETPLADISFDYEEMTGAFVRIRLEVTAMNAQCVQGFTFYDDELRTFRIKRISSRVLDEDHNKLCVPRDYFAALYARSAGGTFVCRYWYAPSARQINRRSICFTGFLAPRRAELETLVARTGLVLVPQVSRDLKFLVAGANPSLSKIQQAVAAGAMVIDEAEYLGLVG